MKYFRISESFLMTSFYSLQDGPEAGQTVKVRAKYFTDVMMDSAIVQDHEITIVLHFQFQTLVIDKLFRVIFKIVAGFTLN